MSNEEARTTTVNAGGVPVRCNVQGPRNAPVVLLAHGILTSLAMWDEVAEQLARHWRVVRYDLRGHGGTPATPGACTMAQLADDAAVLLDALALQQRVHFIGLSLGGMLGQQLGVRHHGRLLSLTLANTAAVQRAPQSWDERIALVRTEGVAPLVEPTLQRWFTPPFLAAGSAAVQRMRALAHATPVEGYVACATAVRCLDHAELLPQIKLPTLVIAGQHDSSTPLAESQQLQWAIAGARLSVLPAAHQSAVECPDLFVQAWQRFAAATTAVHTP